MLRKYRKLCNENIKLNILTIKGVDFDKAHRFQDKIYRTFILDILEDKIKHTDLKEICQMLKDDVLFYDGDNKRWYS